MQLLRPKFLPLLTPTQCALIVQLVQQLILILGSDEVVLDRYHSPAVYSKFLANLLERYYTSSLQARVRAASVPAPLLMIRPDRDHSPPPSYTWPDTPSSPYNLNAEDMVHQLDPTNMLAGSSDQIVRQEIGDLDMDFSLPHFVQSTRNSPEMTWSMFATMPLDTPEGMDCRRPSDTFHDIPHFQDSL